MSCQLDVAVEQGRDRTSLFSVMARTSGVLREKRWDKELIPLSRWLSSDELQNPKSLKLFMIPGSPGRLSGISSHAPSVAAAQGQPRATAAAPEPGMIP